LYSFTHRTFLEYFAATHLAYDCDAPELLARTLAAQPVSDVYPYIERSWGYSWMLAPGMCLSVGSLNMRCLRLAWPAV
jgi:hypothetical protein